MRLLLNTSVRCCLMCIHFQEAFSTVYSLAIMYIPSTTKHCRYIHHTTILSLSKVIVCTVTDVMSYLSTTLCIGNKVYWKHYQCEAMIWDKSRQFRLNIQYCHRLLLLGEGKPPVPTWKNHYPNSLSIPKSFQAMTKTWALFTPSSPNY